MSDSFKDLVAKLNSISADEVLSDDKPVVNESVKGSKQMANILNKFATIETEVINESINVPKPKMPKPSFPKIPAPNTNFAAQAKSYDGGSKAGEWKSGGDKKAKEYTAGGQAQADKWRQEATAGIVVESKQELETSIADRYRDFLKSETSTGETLANVNAAVQEASATADAIDASFDKMFSMMGRLMKVTSEGAVLTKMVEREGGDPSWIADAHQKLIEAMEAIEEAHMYSNRPAED